MGNSDDITSKLEENLQNEFILTNSQGRVEIREGNTKLIRILGYLGIVLLLPIWTSMWLIDNFIFWIYCLKSGFEYEFLSFTSFNDATPYHLVGRITNKIKVEVCSDEHPPPHFHVFVDGVKHSFKIDDCELLFGSKLKPNVKRKIKKWYTNNRESIIENWNKTRISDCNVGEYKEK